MPKPGKAAESHRKKHVVDMSVHPSEPAWIPPDPDECEDTADYTMTPPGATPEDRITVRMVEHLPTSTLVDFALVHHTFHGGKWREVARADSSHDDEVHLHRFSRRTGKQIGSTEQLVPIKSAKDIDTGYYLAYSRIIDEWAENKRRWGDA